VWVQDLGTRTIKDFEVVDEVERCTGLNIPTGSAVDPTSSVRSREFRVPPFDLGTTCP
jgi:hypothetical protein